MTPIDDDLKHDALRALRERRDTRMANGVAHGTRPQEWSDEAQTVGWCLSLLKRWPPDTLRDRMVELLAVFGYTEAAA